MGGTGQSDCDAAADGQGVRKEKYRQGCYDQVNARCKG
jgi:hypothetical protein